MLNIERDLKDVRTKVYFQMIERIENETNEEELEFLSINKNFGIRFLVAKNKNTSSQTLKYLAKDLEEEVRLAARSNRNFISTKRVVKEERETISIFTFIKSFFFSKEIRLN
jgi:chemotaxis response regulator CheB